MTAQPTLIADQAMLHPHVLIVDDDDQIRAMLCRLLQREGFRCHEAGDASAATAELERNRFDAILCDVQMPGESGFSLIERVIDRYPQTAPVMLSGLDDRASVRRALDLGAYGYLTKPFKTTDVVIAMANALHRKTLEEENRGYQGKLENLVSERTEALQKALRRLEASAQQVARSREETIQRLSRAVEFRDEETGNHVERMSRYCEMLATRVGITGSSMRVASPMHDVGKIAVPDCILRKPGRLTRLERTEMQRHCQVGYDLLTGSSSKLLELGATIAHTHHEKFDGSGYPRGLRGEKIPVEGRIAAVADVFDALTTDRVYRAAFPVEEALEMMRQDRGTHFDPVLLDVFLDSIGDALEIRRQFQDRAPTAIPVPG